MIYRRGVPGLVRYGRTGEKGEKGRCKRPGRGSTLLPYRPEETGHGNPQGGEEQQGARAATGGLRGWRAALREGKPALGRRGARLQGEGGDPASLGRPGGSSQTGGQRQEGREIQEEKEKPNDSCERPRAAAP